MHPEGKTIENSARVNEVQEAKRIMDDGGAREGREGGAGSEGGCER